ncbi:MAG: hypothetical protein ACQEVT_15040 [Pseudomonadota bacterium]|uniref:hypothetical protein n=1 Tax=Roseovarius TaxID=74030 RepID=UPI0022A8B1D1|nr:hypothetical protein [Roseovarius sp. EGI FJ00037]MCZ0812504.1 hypothetical protein [Roseovarius sp. EGI FJ00037]
MRQLRSALARGLMVWLVAGFVMGSFGMGVSGAATAAEPAHMMGHAAQSGSDCPTMDDTGAPRHKGHAACAMTVCCFSEAPDFAAHLPDSELIPSNHVLFAEMRLTQAEPERAEKPPRHT